MKVCQKRYSCVLYISLIIKNMNVIQMGKLPIQWIRQGGEFSSRSPTMDRRGTAESAQLFWWREGLKGWLGVKETTR
jgi:hypothetical protein